VPARSFLLAAETGNLSAMRRTLADLRPLLVPAIERTCRRHESLVRRCRLEREDVVQHVFERMLSAPPNNPAGRDPEAVLVAWARTVAIHHLLDLGRRIGRESPSEGEDPPTSGAPQEKQHEVAERWQVARACADTELVRHKHLRELFYAIAREPELGARDLARRIGLLDDEVVDEERARRAEQYVWKLRERVQRKLADYMSFAAKDVERGAR